MQKKKNLSIYAGITGLCISALFCVFLIYTFLYKILPISTANIFLLLYATSVFIGISLYLLFNQRNDDRCLYVISENSSKLLIIVFFLIFCIAIFVLNGILYIKPISYYILVSIATIIIAMQIIANKCITRRKQLIILVQIVVLAVLVGGNTYVISPNLWGRDVYWHYYKIIDIIYLGHIFIEAGHYYYYPMLQLLNAISIIILYIPNDSIFITNLIVSTLSVPLIYLIGREILNEKVGLISSLLLAVSTFHVHASINNSTNMIGLTMVLLSIYIIFKIDRHPNYGFWRYSIIFWLSAIVVFFWHPTDSIVLAIILGTTYLLYHLRLIKANVLPPFQSYAISLVAYLSFVEVNLFAMITKGIFLPKDVDASPLPGIEIPSGETTIMSHLQYVFGYIGIAFMIIMGTYGILKWLEEYDAQKIVLIASLIILNMIPFFSISTQSGGLNPTRLLAPIFFLITIPASSALLFLSGKNNKKIFIILIILFFVTFSSVSSYLTWDNNKIFNDKIFVPIGYNNQHTIAVNTFTGKISKNLAYNVLYFSYFGERPGDKSGIIKQFESSKNKAYDNGEVKVYI